MRFVGSIAGLAAFAMGCASTPPGPLCSPERACASGATCVVGHCRDDAAPTTSEDTKRIVLEPVDVAVLAAHDAGVSRPYAFVFGRAGSGTVELLLRFAPTWSDDADVVSAFVVLTSLEGAPPAATPARLVVARILEPWSSDTASWGRQPMLSAGEGSLTLARFGRRAVRVDVTHVVQGFTREREHDGIALVADGDDAFGAAFALGPTGEPGPRLEVYVKQPISKAAP